MIILYVEPNKVGTYWNHMKPFVNEMVDKMKGRTSALQIFDELTKGDKDLFVVLDGENNGQFRSFFVLAVIQYPSIKACSVEYVGGRGSLGIIDDCLQVIDEYAIMNKCDTVQLLGRVGWVREMKSRGFETTLVLSEREVNGR